MQSINRAERRRSRRELAKRPQWGILEEFARSRIQSWLQDVLEEELTELLGRGKSERRAVVDAPAGYRNGHGKTRRLSMMAGTIEAHDSFDSRCPLSIANTTLRPSRKVPRSPAARPCYPQEPLSHRDRRPRRTLLRELSSRRLRHASNSSCHFARSRSIDDAQSGAPSPSSPRNASSKSPWASP